MKKMETETKVGIFVLLGIIVLAFLTLTVGKFHLGKEAGYRVYALFDSAAGVNRNSPVRIAGVNVGTVERISLERGKAKLALRIPPNIQFYEDARAYLRSEGLLGERYIEIFPGSEEKPRIKEEGMIQQGASPVSLEQVLSRLSGIGEDIKGVLVPLSQILEGVDPEKVGNVVSNFETFSGDFPQLIADAREMFGNFRNISTKLQRGEGTLGKLINDDGAYWDARETLVALREMTEKLQRGEGTLGKLINDDGAYRDARETLVALREMTEKLQRGEGTLGKLINEEEAYLDARATLANFKSFSEKLDSGEGTVGKLLTDDHLIKEAEKTLKKVQKGAEGLREQTPITVLGTLMGLIF
ncbi:MAG: MCE family protein [Syntrophobacterales bacterium]|nr:MAG: MCE family protein [Syntrophobacterales bacterium]